MNNLHIVQLLDIAYDIAKSEYKEKSFTFSMIWSKTWKSAVDFKKEPVNEWIGFFYSQLQLDPRFVNCSSNTIRLKEFMNFNEFKNLDKLMFGIDDESSDLLEKKKISSKDDLVDEADLKELEEEGMESEMVEESDEENSGFGIEVNDVLPDEEY